MDVSRPEELAEEFFRHYYDVLMVYAMAILEDRYLAEEATQETFRTVCEHYEELEAIQYPKAWLKKILYNIMRNRIREKAQRRQILLSIEELDKENDESAMGVTIDPTNLDLEYGALIPQKDFQLLKRLATDDCTYVEAAVELGISADTCRKRAIRAAKKLSDRLKGMDQ